MALAGMTTEYVLQMAMNLAVQFHQANSNAAEHAEDLALHVKELCEGHQHVRIIAHR